MVGIVKNTVSRMEPRKVAVPDRVSQEATKVSSAAAANASDSVELKSADVPSSIKQMASSTYHQNVGTSGNITPQTNKKLVRLTPAKAVLSSNG